MKAEEGIGEKIVEGCPGPIPVIGKFGVSTVTRDGECFPFGNVDFGDVLRTH